jgi:hypothetical protein
VVQLTLDERTRAAMEIEIAGQAAQKGTPCCTREGEGGEKKKTKKKKEEWRVINTILNTIFIDKTSQNTILNVALMMSV